MHKPVALVAALLLAGTVAGFRTQEKPGDPGLTLFRQHIRPVLTTKCLTCHDAVKKKGGLDLSRRAGALAGGDSGPALAPGNPGKSLLFERVHDKEMPPQNPLSESQIQAFRRWIAAGAPYEGEPLTSAIRRASLDWWSLKPVTRPPLPKVRQAGWVRTPIDAFILAKLEENGLHPAPEADRATLLRRVKFDLLGLPPTPEEIDAFVRDTSTDAYEKVIDRFLASPHYGERWGRHWLDVVRYAESHGYETNHVRGNAWPYRDYVIRAFNRDTPYPQFILEQLAGDALPSGDGLSRAATGFLVAGAHDEVANASIEGQAQKRADDLDDMISATGATFLGLTVNCARCHDHKFDPISQKDYYSLQAVFSGVIHDEREIADPDLDRQIAKARADADAVDRRLDDLEPEAEPFADQPRRPAVNARRNVDRFPAVQARFLRFTVAGTGDDTEPCLDELEVYTAEKGPRNVALAAAGTTARASSEYPAPQYKAAHVIDGRFGKGWSWMSAQAGKGWVELEFSKTETIDRVVWGRDREEKLKDRLPTAYQIEVAAAVGKWQVVATSADRVPLPLAARLSHIPQLPASKQRQRNSLLKDRDAALAHLNVLAGRRLVYAGRFVQPGPSFVLLRGDPLRTGEVVVPAGLSAVRPALRLDGKSPERERRLALARWLGSPDNPLPARVMVNRVWQYHFGEGLVATASDFGFNGARPTHPALLDWLAAEFQGNGWRLKPLHRLILLSAAYRQSGRADATALAVDRFNRLVWRLAPRRLSGEEVRDAMLSVSGKLDLRLGGPGFSVWEHSTNFTTSYRPKAELGPEEFRRMVYQFAPRSLKDPTFGVFDCPDGALARPKRTVSTTVLQALNLLNSREVLAQADFFAERLRREAGADPAAQVRRAFALAFGRAPAAHEQTAAAALVQAHGLAALCRALFNANEFLYVD
jgi:hypothetical protein